MKDRLTILCGDALEQLKTLPDESVHCCVTSPPYWGLRDYGVHGQLGLEKTPEEYVAKMVEVFREVRRVLRDDGTCWVNLGDSYARQAGDDSTKATDSGMKTGRTGKSELLFKSGNNVPPPGLKPKDLCGIPWRVAFALQADGWYLRSDIIWAKPNPMPESVTDRPTKSHEYLFLLSKNERYFYDAEAIKEQATNEPHNSGYVNGEEYAVGPMNRNGHSQREDPDRVWATNGMRNKRTVWTVPSFAFPESHFATYPPDLIKPCILAGTSAKGCCEKCGAPWERMMEDSNEPNSNKPIGKGIELDANGTHHGQNSRRGEVGSFSNNKSLRPQSPRTIGWRKTCTCGSSPIKDRQDDKGLRQDIKKRIESQNLGESIREEKANPCTVLDPFGGSGTTGMVALELGRKAILIELNPKYVHLIKQRCDVTPGLPLA